MTPQRIKEEAETLDNILKSNDYRIGFKYGYIAGATAVNDRAQGLVDALEELITLEKIKDELGETTNYLARQPQAWQRAKEELAKWKGEAEQSVINNNQKLI